MNEKINAEAMVHDQNLTPAPKTGAEQNENHEVNMESKEQDAGIRTLGDQLAGDEATKVPTPEIPDAPAAEEETPESTDENVDGTTEAPTEEELAELEARKRKNVTDLFSGATAFMSAIVKAIIAFVNGLMANSVETKSRTIFPFRSSWDAGYRPAFLVGNRGIDRSHLEGLRALLKESGKTKFTVCGTVTPLLPLLELMAGLPEADRLHFYDILGNEITLDTPGVREGLYYLVLDGQHRVGACYVHNLDMDLQLVEIEGNPIDFIADYNTGGKGWQTQDWVKAHRATGVYTSDLYDKMDEVGNILPSASERLKVYILTGNRDGIKKSDAIHGKEAVDYDEKMALRGIGFAKAIAVALPRTGKDLSNNQKLVAKYFTSLAGIDLVYDVSSKIAGELLASYDTDMKNFLGNFSDKQIKDIADQINAKNIGDLKKYFLAEYKKFAGAHAADREDLSAAIDTKYTKLAEKRGKKAEEDRRKALTPSSSERPTKLKEGTLAEMKQNAEALQKYAEKKETLERAKGIKH